jgi:uncharacterized membrane protein YdjX (TVP38/TMEM64 family)
MRRIAHPGSKVFRLAAMLVAFVASLALIAYGLRDELLDVVVWVGETMREAPVWGAFIFFLASAGSVLFLFLSSVLLVPSAILVWGEWPTFLLLSTGWLSGWTTTYAIGRFFRDRAFVGNKLSRHPLEKTFFLSGKLPFSLVLIVVCSLPAEIPGYALGAARYPFGPFLLAVALAEIPFAFLIVFIGESFIRENVGLFAGLIVVLCAVLVWEVKSAHRLRRLS